MRNSRAAANTWRTALLGSVCAVLAVAAPRPPTLTSIQKVRSLKGEEAKRSYPVRLKGIVTYFDPVAPDLFLQDASGAVWVKWAPGLPQPETGSLIDLQGVTTWSDFAPDIGNPRWTVLGRAPLPKPRRVSFEQMASTAEDSLWVEVEGIVRQAEFLHRTPTERVFWMALGVPGGPVDVSIPWQGAPVPAVLVDAKVRVDALRWKSIPVCPARSPAIRTGCIKFC